MNDATGRNQDGKAAQDNDTSADDTTAQDGIAVSVKHTTDAARGVRDWLSDRSDDGLTTYQ